ncbi:MAG: hypothetical protein M1477_00945 [Candidatus Thermoplasmatota archaeon]|nr:hypothetical protein [Candidatus Thermoplasmatota archaeon]MCL5988781.1 hypothetical protein [Candidatus Thermoplasmatota archaeon]
MRKGRFIAGIVLLVIGFLAFLISVIKYSQLMALVNSFGGQVAIGLNQTLANQVSAALSTYIIGMIIGGILVIVGIVLMILGYKGSSGTVKVK